MKKTYLGIELGSTRIKAVSIDTRHLPVSSGDFTWKTTSTTASGPTTWPSFGLACVHPWPALCSRRMWPPWAFPA